MTQGQPKTRTQELLDQINGLSAADLANEFLLRSLERQARQVLSTGEAECGYTLLGALAAARQDVDDTQCFHDKAVALASRDPDVYRNYAISLVRVGLIDDAISMADRAWRLDNSQLSNLRLLVQLTCHGGRIREAVDQLHAAKFTRQDDVKIAELEDAASLLASYGISDGIARSITQTALAVVSPISVRGVINRVISDDESKWVDFALTVDDSTERVIELNLAFAERMAKLSLDSDISRATSAFVVRFTRNQGMDAGISP